MSELYSIQIRDPFQLPADPTDKKVAMERKQRFAGDSYSDHMAMFKVYKVGKT